MLARLAGVAAARRAGPARKLSLANVAENGIGGFDVVQIQSIAYLSGALVVTLAGAGISALIFFDLRTSKSIKEVKESIKESEARTSASITEVKESIKESEARTSASIKESEARTSASITEVKESIKEVKELIKESLGARAKGSESSSKRPGWWSG